MDSWSSGRQSRIHSRCQDLATSSWGTQRAGRYPLTFRSTVSIGANATKTIRQTFMMNVPAGDYQFSAFPELAFVTTRMPTSDNCDDTVELERLDPLLEWAEQQT